LVPVPVCTKANPDGLEKPMLIGVLVASVPVTVVVVADCQSAHSTVTAWLGTTVRAAAKAAAIFKRWSMSNPCRSGARREDDCIPARRAN